MPESWTMIFAGTCKAFAWTVRPARSILCWRKNLGSRECPPTVPGRSARCSLWSRRWKDAEDNYNASRKGVIPERLWVDCVLASNVDDSLAPKDRHVLTCFVQYLPYKLQEGNWDERREQLGDRVTELIERFAPGFGGSVIARRVFSPHDLEERFGITEGNIFHGDISLQQMFLHATAAPLGAIPGADRPPVPVAAPGRIRAAA